MKSAIKSLILALTIVGCLAVRVYAEEGILVVHVTNTEGRALSGIVLSTKGDGSVSSPTDRAGRTRIRLAPSTRPGKWVNLQVVQRSDAKAWVFISPWDARVLVPPFENESNNFVPVVLARRSDRVLLENGNALEAITKSILSDIASKTTEKGISEEQRRAVLVEQAQKYGLNPEEIDKAIRAWGERAKDPFDKGLTALYAKNYPEATKKLSESLELRERELKKSQANYVDVATFLGQSLYAQGKYRPSAEVIDRAVSIRGDDSKLLNQLGRSLWSAGVYARAEDTLIRALKLAEKGPEINYLDVAGILSNLGVLSGTLQRHDEAEGRLRRALELRKQHLGPEHPEVARALGNLGSLLIYRRKFSDAETLIKQALFIAENSPNPDYSDIGKFLVSLGLLYLNQANSSEAERFYNRALKLQEDKLGQEHPDLALSLDALAIISYLKGNLGEAVSTLVKARDIREKSLGPNHPYVANTLSNLGAMYMALKRAPDAEPILKRALMINENALGPDHPELAKILGNLAELYYEQNRYAEAITMYGRFLPILEKMTWLEKYQIGEYLGMLRHYAELLRKMNRENEAKNVEERAKVIRDRNTNED